MLRGGGEVNANTQSCAHPATNQLPNIFANFKPHDGEFIMGYRDDTFITVNYKEARKPVHHDCVSAHLIVNFCLDREQTQPRVQWACGHGVGKNKIK